jgi:glycosyltransferase involved in cell wall biosynthesis
VRICLVAAINPCHNPRLVREADTLARAGHQVRVVALGILPTLSKFDERLLRSRNWKLERIDLHPSVLEKRPYSLWMRARRRLAAFSFDRLKWSRLAEYSVCTGVPELAKLAAAEPADWIIAHTQPVLPAATFAAKYRNSRLGFDCEDLLSETGQDSCEAIRRIEHRYLPECHYVSVTSKCMAAYLERTYGIFSTVLYNVFPLSLAEGLIRPQCRQPYSPLRLHWVSQTLAIDRGLQDILEASATVGKEIELHLRGQLSDERKSVILNFAERCGIATLIHFHPLIGHDELVKSMAQYDVGLALERPNHQNYSRTVTNKIFSYLLAGLAIAVTDTPGQREVLDQVPAAGFLYPAGDSAILAKRLGDWINNPASLLTAKQAAWDAARSKFCWDIEQLKFLRLLGESRNAIGKVAEVTTK